MQFELNDKKKIDELTKRLEAFYRSCADLSEITGDLPIQLKDVFLDGYPFDKSFNDLSVDVYRWVNKVKSNLE